MYDIVIKGLFTIFYLHSYIIETNDITFCKIKLFYLLEEATLSVVK